MPAVDQRPDTPFVEAAEPVLAALQEELRAVIARVPGAETPTDLRNALGLSYSLSWKIARAATAETPLEAGPFMPTPSAIRTLAAAAERHDAMPPDSRLAEASEAFRGLVAERAGDRPTFDTMVSAMTGSDADRLNAELKRSAFRINCQVMGKLVGTTLSSVLVGPGAGGRFDRVSFRYVLGFQRLRPGASLRLATAREDWSNDGGERPIEAINGGTDGHGVGLLRAFCTEDLPPMRVATRDGKHIVSFTTPDLGTAAGIDIALGYISRGEPRTMTPKTLNVITSTPARVQIQDMFIHRSVYDGNRVELDVFAKPHVPDSDSDPLPIPERAARIGRGRWTTRCPEIPRYGELTDYVFGRMGWDIEDFNLYRCRIEHPVLHSYSRMRIDCPSDPP